MTLEEMFLSVVSQSFEHRSDCTFELKNGEEVLIDDNTKLETDSKGFFLDEKRIEYSELERNV